MKAVSGSFKTTEEDSQEEATMSLAAALEINADAEVAATLSESGGIFF